MSLRRISTTLLLLVFSAAHARAAPSIQELFASMSGSWSGAGQIQYEGYPSEALRCKAYYTTKDQLGHLNIALRCASASNKIELRAQLTAQGNALAGSWEERTFNVNGTATGSISEQQISLSIDGGGFAATMVVAQDESNQTVAITTKGVGFNGVNVSLTRTGGENDRPTGNAVGTSDAFAGQ